MFESLIPLIQSQVDSRRIVTDIREIHARDRWFTYPKFLQTAAYARKRLRQAGLKKPEIIEFPADGKTLFGTWRAGYAWDVKSATLTVLAPKSRAGTVLADYRKIPCSLAMWSAPTPKGGVHADVIDVGTGTAESDYAGKNVKGNIVFANARAGAVKALAAKYGAVGILTDWNPQQKANREAVFWNNAFADAPGGWPLTTKCTRLFAFGISPNTGQKLRRLLASGKSLRVHAAVNTRIYNGTFPIATGAILGKSGEEILALAHAFEQGAKDNASGVACILEATRVLASLIREGVLPTPRRAIRTLVTNECFGTIGYVDRYPQRAKNTVAAICLDETGLDKQTTAEVQALLVNPQSNANYLDSLVAPLAEAIWKKPFFNPYVLKPYGSSDNLIAHPTIGIPAVWMGCHGSRITWHTTIDTPERMSPQQLAAATVYTAVYLYFLANAGPREAMWLANLSAANGRNQMQQEQVAAHAQILAAPASKQRDIQTGLSQRLAYLAQIHGNAVASVLRLASTKPAKNAVARHLKDLRQWADDLNTPTGSARRTKARTGTRIRSPFGTKLPPGASKVFPTTAFSGPLTHDPIPADERARHEDPRWGLPVNVALGWADGRRTLAEIVALTEHETRSPQPSLAEELLWLTRAAPTLFKREPRAKR